MSTRNKHKLFFLYRVTAVAILAASILSLSFTGCKNQSEKNTSALEYAEVPFYYMIFTASYSGVPEKPYDAVFTYYNTVIHSLEELKSDRIYQATMVSQDSTRVSINKILPDRYNENFFKTHDLLYFFIEEGGGSNYHDVAEIRKIGTVLEIKLRYYLPLYGSDEATRIRFTLIEVPKGYFPESTGFPEIVTQIVAPEDPLYAGLEEAKYHRFPGGVMEDVH